MTLLLSNDDIEHLLVMAELIDVLKFRTGSWQRGAVATGCAPIS